MCLAIPPNSSRSQQYSLPPYWCPYQEASSSSAAAAGAASTSTTATTTNTNKYERYYPMAETSSSSSPYASPSSFGSVANPVGCGGGAGASSLVSNNSSSSASSSSSLDLLFPATPPPPSPTDAFEYGLGQIMMGLSPLIMQGGSSSISNHITNENDNITTSLPPNLQSLMATNTTTNFNNWMMMGTNIAATTTNTTTSATATTTTTTTHRRRRAPQRPGKTATQKERLFVQHNYHDLANCYDDDDDNNAAASNEDSSLSESIPEQQQQQQHQPFPIKLHHLLEECEALGLSHIISWQPHGRAFKIHNPTLFTTSIMSKYFPKMKKLPSLQRQFNLYGFERLTREGPDAGAYYHEAFLRYRPSLSVTNMTRRRVKGTGYKAASNPEAEPNLYSYPYMTREQQQQRQSCTTSSRSSVSSTTTTDRCSYYSTSSEEESTYPKMNPQVVSSSLSPSSTCWYNHPSMTTTTSGGSNQQHHHRNSSSSFMGYLDSLSQSTATTSPQSAVAQDPSMDSFLQDDVLTSNDVDAFMAKYLNEEETMISSSSSSRRYQDLLVPSSPTASTWPASSSTMPFLQDDRSGCSSSSNSTDVDSFMDRYLALPRTAQDSILDDLLCLNEGGSNSIGGSSSSSTGGGGGGISFSFDSL
jgi:hypothetical protein